MDKKLLIEKEYGKENETAVYERISRSILDFWGIKDENITSYSILEGTNIIYRICYDNPLYETLSVPNKNYQLETLIIPSSVREIRYADLPLAICNVICYSPFFEVENKTLFSKDKKELIRCFDYFNQEEYIIPNEVEHVRRDAFFSCRFRKIIIGTSVKFFEDNPFMNMASPNKYIELESQSDDFFVDGEGGLYSNNNELIAYVGKGSEYQVLSGTSSIQDYAFSGTSVRIIWLPSSIKGFNIDKYHPIDNLLFIIPTILKYDYSSYSPHIMDEITYRNSFKPPKYPGNY
jgi:hypothetical protein